MKVKNKSVSNHPGSILSKLFRNILEDFGKLKSYKNLIDRYKIRKEEEAKLKNEKPKYKTSHNLVMDIFSDKLSVDGFIYLVRELLNIPRIRITIELEHSNKQITVHNTGWINLNTFKKENRKEKENGSGASRESKGS